ncbi:MAG: hypothetical protein R2724_34345 [Bryobacterales bacterium]
MNQEKYNELMERAKVKGNLEGIQKKDFLEFLLSLSDSGMHPVDMGLVLYNSKEQFYASGKMFSWFYDTYLDKQIRRFENGYYRKYGREHEQEMAKFFKEQLKILLRLSSIIAKLDT